MGKSIQNGFYKFVALPAIVIIYLFLPTNNASLDAYDYACSAKYGIDLFHPHHLLFNGFFHLEYKFLGGIFPSIDVLKMMQATNALFALGTLAIAYYALKMISSDAKSKALVFLCACTFGMLRFATEAETYIIPLFFSLLSTLLFIKEMKADNAKYASWCGLSFSMACLFHQTALFWGIGLLIGFFIANKKGSALWFSLTSLTIPIVYILAMPKTGDAPLLTELFRFMTDYYQSDSADMQLDWRNLVMTPISLFRTIYQVHGNIPIILEKEKELRMISIIALVIVLYCFVRIGIAIYQTAKKGSCTLRLKAQLGAVEISHAIAFTLSLLFAAFSHGNAEFMVMLPLCAIFFLHKYIADTGKEMRLSNWFAISALLWNMSTAIIPSHEKDYYGEENIVTHIHDHPQATYLLRDKNSVANKYYYQYGAPPQAHLVRADREDQVNRLKQQNYDDRQMEIYSDVMSRPAPLSRGNILENIDITYQTHHRMWIAGFLGTYTLDQIRFFPSQEESNTLFENYFHHVIQNSGTQ